MWTEARKRAFIISGLRQTSRRYPPRYETLADAYTGQKLNTKTNRVGKHYECNVCKKQYPAKEVQIDHIIPVIDPEVGFVDWNTYIERMFCDKANLQTICLGCHTVKTNQEKKKKKTSANQKDSKD